MNENRPDEISSATPMLSRVDALIIAVGARQIGWRTQDGIVRYFDGDGDGRSKHPLAREFETDTSKFTLRDLSRQYYRHCRDRLSGDFSAVELMLDEPILRDSVRSGLGRLILWGTERPSDYPLSHRDTIALAHLMAGKVRGDFPQLAVEVVALSALLDDEAGIRQELEEKVLPRALPSTGKSTESDGLVLAIQSRGSESAIDRACAQCVVALSRHGRAIDFTPILPNPFEEEATLKSIAYRANLVGDYGWSWERSRIVAAWERGDFKEAQIALSYHPLRYGGLLGNLARQLEGWKQGKISLSVLHSSTDSLEAWLNSPQLPELATPERVRHWQQQLEELRTRPESQAWEATFLMDLLLKNNDSPEAFLQFARILERFLYLQYKEQKWLEKGYVSRPKYLNHLGNSYQPGLKRLVDTWLRVTGRSQTGAVDRLFDNICNTRTIILQKTETVPFDEILLVWSKNGWPIEFTRPPYLGLMQRMHEALKMVCDPAWSIAEPTLGRSLYEWGLKVLQQRSPSTRVDSTKSWKQ
ncbi:hypothetical protein IQ235_02300 [Oscillatoriales cyanobacterium LEGE 11467]|uniref:Uncharacterized protein n=1 Tax=Zarconia navalis LEGE 11467 TaxID=1828826 RepID=A0A928Z8A1_9CYAN|nr:hypothetical protein [Zarconia navalis]MBE9039626.1 hypothetical protein [Zarconia navalis LEGE 11467]